MFKNKRLILMTMFLLLASILGRPAEAVRSFQSYYIMVFYCPWICKYSLYSTVDGWNSSSYPNKIWIDRHSADGLIFNYKQYPFNQSVMVYEGRFYEGNSVVETYWNGDLSPYSIIYDPAHKPWWGGEYYPRFYMSRSTLNKVWTKTVWSTPGVIWPVYTENEHVFYNNGWQNVI